MTRRRAGALCGIVLVMLAAGTAGCGQQGPLVLPEDARPIERLDPPPGGAQPETQDDDERTRER
jgi:predicted small lipoprotein YifL